ncbi:MAG: TRM11 family methyltransferase [Candidatus Dojkabacteria bacterium]
MSKQYFFEAGSFPDLSYTELVSVFEAYELKKDIIHRFSDSLFLVKSLDVKEETLDKVFKRLGGFVRYGAIIDDLDEFLNAFSTHEGKITFGITVLGEYSDVFSKKLGNNIKKGLRECGISSRFVSPLRGEKALNAAQIIHNNILAKGFELCLLNNGKEDIYGSTLGVQNIEEFVRRDLDKPYANIEMGVLPPKLARMMVNFTGRRDGVIWDPFCGSGTIPMEAAVLGFNFFASDIDSNAVHDTEENVRWMDREEIIQDIFYEAFTLDVKQPDHEVVKKLKNSDISAIVCEPYMGVAQKRELSEQSADILLKEVESLYKALFDLIDNKIEKRGLKVVLIIPSYKTKNGWRTFGIRDFITNRWELLNTYYSGGRDLKWSRKNSIITRNIFILNRT